MNGVQGDFGECEGAGGKCNNIPCLAVIPLLTAPRGSPVVDLFATCSFCMSVFDLFVLDDCLAARGVGGSWSFCSSCVFL